MPSALLQPQNASEPKTIHGPIRDCGHTCAGNTFEGRTVFVFMENLARQYGPRPRTFDESIPWFWKLVVKGSPACCWKWSGARLSDGYGRFKTDGKFITSHRFSYILHFGDIPKNQCVCHRCDNPPCCNPEHLFLGTKKENADDRDKKGRNVNFHGEEHGSSKLTAVDVIKIRDSYKTGTVTQLSLARQFGVSKSAIMMIVTNRNWRHL